MYYNLNGIPSAAPVEENYFVVFNGHDFSLKDGDLTYDIDGLCVRLHHAFADKIFGSVQEYYKLMPYLNALITSAGLDPEANISKDDFATLVLKLETNETFNRLMYYHDCKNLISTLQNSVSETKYLLGKFYETLNRNSFLLSEIIQQPETVIMASGIVTTNIYSIINSLFINLYSQLDFISKTIYEIEHIVTDFKKYPKLKSSKILFGGANQTSLYNVPDTLLVPSNPTIKTIVNLRNELVHNASFENHPRVYIVIKEERVVEKFILLPDMEEGNIKSFRNRNRFFHDEVKLNEILPELIKDFWKKLKYTLDLVIIDKQ